MGLGKLFWTHLALILENTLRSLEKRILCIFEHQYLKAGFVIMEYI
jgi:hypothetical protein